MKTEKCIALIFFFEHADKRARDFNCWNRLSSGELAYSTAVVAAWLYFSSALPLIFLQEYLSRRIQNHRFP